MSDYTPDTDFIASGDSYTPEKSFGGTLPPAFAEFTAFESEILYSQTAKSQLLTLAAELLTGGDYTTAQSSNISAELLHNTDTTLRTSALSVEVLATNVFAKTSRLAVEIMTRELILETVRFRDDAALLLGKLQATVGNPENLDSSHAIAGIDLSFEDEITYTISEFGESAVGRSADVAIGNVLRNVQFQSLFPAINPPDNLEFPFNDWFEACGGVFSLQNDDQTLWIFTNEFPSTKSLTLEVHRFPENATDRENANIYAITDAIGIVGLDLQAGKRGKLTFKFQGNPHLPKYLPRTGYNLENQKLNILGPINKRTVIKSIITDLETGNALDVCFYRLQTDSLFGYELNQSQLSCEELVTKVPKPTPVALTVIVTNKNSVVEMTPEYCLGRRYSLYMEFGSEAYPIKLEMTELQMADYKKASINDLAGLAIGFINTGFTRLTFTSVTLE